MNTKLAIVLREHGRSVTKSRGLLFEYLQKQGLVHLQQFLRDNRAVADQASLYRTLALFKELGVIDERIVAGQRVIELTDTYDRHHHHLTCMRCSTSVDVTMPEIEQALESLCAARGFKVEKHLIEVDGYCENCQ